MDQLGEIAKQGLLGLFLSLSLLVNYLIYKENRLLSKQLLEEVSRRSMDIISIKDSFQQSLDTMREAYSQNSEKTNSVLGSILLTVQNLQQLVQSKKR